MLLHVRIGSLKGGGYVTSEYGGVSNMSEYSHDRG